MQKFIFIFLTLTALYGNAQQLSDQQKQLLKQMGINASNPQEAFKQIQQMKQKGQQPDYKAGGQKLISQMMADPNSYDTTAAKYYFASNTSLIPAKDVKRINSISKKIFSDAEMLSNTKLLYSKMIAKIPAAEKAIITTVAAQNAVGNDLNRASVTAMMQGHPMAALGLAMQSVIAKPSNLNCQNNLAALLTQNGYPENAIPYLNKILQQIPNNSTVLNNLGYAWLNLGATDSAQRILTAAAMLNPENAETTTAVGVIEEKNGNTQEAGVKFDQAFDQAPSSMMEIILGHVGKPNPTLEYMQKTYDQFKDKLTIYEYFTKEWETVPDYSNNVSGYLKDYALRKGYEKMFKDVDSKIRRIEDSVNQLKEGDVFVANVGRNSNIARYALPAIVHKMGIFREQYLEDAAAMEEFQKEEYKKAEDKAFEAGRHEEKCGVEDPFWNQYLQKVNPIIQKFHKSRIAKFRVIINAFITATLLIHQKATKRDLQDILNYSRLFIATSMLGASSLQYQHQECPFDANLDELITPVNDYAIPKFLCPISANSKLGYNNSNTNIKKSTTGNVPNATIAIGSKDGGVAEPGKGGTPFVKSSQGDVNWAGYNAMDTYGDFQQCIEEANDPVSPIPSQVSEMDRLTPLAQIVKKEENSAPPASINVEDDLAPLVNIIVKHNLKQWLQNQLGTNCDDLTKFDQNPSYPKLPDIRAELDIDQQNLQNKQDQLNQQNDPANAEQIASGKYLQEEIAKGQQNIDQKNQTDPGWMDKISAVVPTIVNSLQNPGSITSFIKGLFN